MITAPLLMVLLAANTAPEVVGRIVRESGAPVAADVVLVGDSRGGVPAETRLRSGADGRVAISRTALPATLFASAPGCAPAAARLSALDETFTLILPAPRRIRGRVVGPDGAPVAGAAVRLMEVAAGDGSPAFPLLGEGVGPAASHALPESLGPTTRTADSGDYSLEGVPPGGVTLSFSEPRFLSEWVRCNGAMQDVRLRPGCHVRGRVLDGARGEAGWEVVALHARAAPGSVRSGADGSFLLSGLPPGDYVVCARPPVGGTRVAAAVPVHLTEGQPEAEVTLAVAAGGVIAGRAVDAESGAPAEGVEITVTSPAGRKERVVSDADGRFRARVPAGACVVGPEFPIGLKETGVPVTVVDGAEVSAMVPVRGWAEIRGVARDAAGAPLPGTVVQVTGLGIGPAVALAGADGAFRVAGITGGIIPAMDELVGGRPAATSIVLTARRGPLGLAAPLTLKPPYPKVLPLSLGMLPRVLLRGRVVDERQRPLAGVPVRLVGETGGLLEQMMGGAAASPAGESLPPAVTGPDGACTFASYQLSARYHLKPASDRYFALSGGELLGDQGPERRLTDLAVVPLDAFLTGRVLDTQRRPVPGARVFWLSGSHYQDAVTDGEGRFRIDGLPRRRVTLVARDVGPRSAILQAEPGKEAIMVLGP